MDNKIQIFEKQQVRSVWDEGEEKWWFSVLDIIAILTEQSDYKKVRNYWKWLKNKLKEEGSDLFYHEQNNEVVSITNHLKSKDELVSSTNQLKPLETEKNELVTNCYQLKPFEVEKNELVTNCYQLKLLAPDGKMRLTDVADIEQILRIIQSIPSKKAEPFKMWLAQVGRERIDEAIDPEISIDRAIQNYRRLGYSENWINQRIKSIEVRKALTDEWDKAGVKQGKEYAFLTDLMTKTWSGMTTKQYRQHKNLKKENLRDNMTNLELIINMLSEATTTELSSKSNPQNIQESALIAHKGASVAKNTRLEIEQKGGEVITSQNAKQLGKRNDFKKIQ